MYLEQQQTIKWEKPPSGFIKCNVDAAFLNTLNRIRFGICARDSCGHVLVAKTLWCEPVFLGREGEAMGLFYALQWAASQNYLTCFLKWMVKGWWTASTSQRRTSLNSAILSRNAIRFLVFPNFGVNFVRRQTSAVAHKLVRVVVNLASPRVFIDAPSLTANLILMEML